MNLMINYSHKWWYKLITAVLVVSIVIMISFGAAPPARAVGVLTMTVCAAILAVMAGAGIATVVSGMTSSDIQSWLNGKLNDWDTARNDGNVFTDLINGNLITMTVKGALSIGNAAARGISDFITWLKTNLSLTDNTTVEVFNNGLPSVPYNPNGTYYDGVHSEGYLPLLYNGYNWACFSRTNIPVVCFAYYQSNNSGYIDIAFVSTGTAEVRCGWGYGGYYTYSTINVYNNLFYYSYTTRGLSPSQLYIPLFDSIEDGLNSISFQNGEFANGSLSLDSDVINIPDVTESQDIDIVIGIEGVYPGAEIEDATDVIMDGVTTNTLDTTMTVTDEYTDAIEAVIINEQPISVNTDHHMIGFTNLPDFSGLHLYSIWHYVSDAVDYASGWISWFVGMLSSVPTLAIPLYMSFTTLIVLSFIRRILL